MKFNYFMNNETGELVTYSQARKEFYSVKRGPFESIFDEYTETNDESSETITAPNFMQVFA